MKKNYFLIFGTLTLLLFSGYFGVQKYLNNEGENVVGKENIESKASSLKKEESIQQDKMQISTKKNNRFKGTFIAISGDFIAENRNGEIWITSIEEEKSFYTGYKNYNRLNHALYLYPNGISVLFDERLEDHVVFVLTLDNNPLNQSEIKEIKTHSIIKKIGVDDNGSHYFLSQKGDEVSILSFNEFPKIINSDIKIKPSYHLASGSTSLVGIDVNSTNVQFQNLTTHNLFDTKIEEPFELINYDNNILVIGYTNTIKIYDLEQDTKQISAINISKYIEYDFKKERLLYSEIFIGINSVFVIVESKNRATDDIKVNLLKYSKAKNSWELLHAYKTTENKSFNINNDNILFINNGKIKKYSLKN